MKSKAGFTLLETLIAMMILSAAIILLSSAWSGSYARLRKTKLRTEVVALLQRKMAEVDMKYKGKPVDSIQELEEGDFGTEYPQYSWSVEAQDFNFPDLSSILTGQEGGANEVLLLVMRSLREHLNKSVKEVRVNVHYSHAEGEEPLIYSITTYYVDYNRQVSIPGLGAAGGH